MSAPLDFYCPACGALAGEPCEGRPLGGSTHAARNPTPRRIRELPGQQSFFPTGAAGRQEARRAP